MKLRFSNVQERLRTRLVTVWHDDYSVGTYKARYVEEMTLHYSSALENLKQEIYNKTYKVLTV